MESDLALGRSLGSQGDLGLGTFRRPRDGFQQLLAVAAQPLEDEIGRASCRERV